MNLLRAIGVHQTIFLISCAAAILCRALDIFLLIYFDVRLPNQTAFDSAFLLIIYCAAIYPVFAVQACFHADGIQFPALRKLFFYVLLNCVIVVLVLVSCFILTLVFTPDVIFENMH